MVVFLRRDRRGRELIAAVNFSPVAQGESRFGVPPNKRYREVFTTDCAEYGGTGEWRNEKTVEVLPIPSHGREQSLCVKLPPLGAAFFAGEGVWKKEQASIASDAGTPDN